MNSKDQEISRRVIVVWTQRTKRSPSGWLLCEPKGPGDNQAGMIAVWTQRTRRSTGGWSLQNLCLWTWLQSAHNLSFLLAHHFRKVVKEMFQDSETAKKLSWGQPIWGVNCMGVHYLGIVLVCAHLQMACSASSRCLHCKLWSSTIELDFYTVCWFDCGWSGAWDQSHAGQVLPMPECFYLAYSRR